MCECAREESYWRFFFFKKIFSNYAATAQIFVAGMIQPLAYSLFGLFISCYVVFTFVFCVRFCVVAQVYHICIGYILYFSVMCLFPEKSIIFFEYTVNRQTVLLP